MDIINIIDTMISEKSDVYFEETSLSENELFSKISENKIIGYYYDTGNIVYTIRRCENLYEIFIFNKILFVRKCNNNMICFITINDLTRCILASSFNEYAYDWMTKAELVYNEISKLFKRTDCGMAGEVLLE